MTPPAADVTVPTADATVPAARRRLRTRFFIAISVLVALVLIAFCLVLVMANARHLRDQIERQAESYATLAADPACVAYALYHDSGRSKFRVLLRELMMLNGDLDTLAIYDVDGRQLFHSDRLADDPIAAAAARGGDRLDAPVDDVRDGARLRSALARLKASSWREPAGDGQEGRYVMVVPYIEDWGRHPYSVAFTFTYRSLNAALRASVQQILILGGVALLFGIGCAVLLLNQILDPLGRLTAGARRLAEGDLDRRIDLHTGDEFQVLGDTLDRMAQRLASTIATLEASNRRLAGINDALKAVDRVKSDLLATVSHELRTPLTAARGYVEALDQALLGPVTDDQRRALSTVERNLRRLGGMIDHLLDHSRMERGTLPVARAPFDLAATAASVVDGLRAIHGDDLRIALDADVDLPRVDGDAERIGQVIENLLTNALKFSPDDAPVTLVLRAVDGGVEVQIVDRGIGVPPEERMRIFERFHQIDSGSQRRYGGMGLGLAIVRELLTLHDSEIHLRDTPDGGSTFWFVLPCADEARATCPPDGAVRVPGARRALIADADEAFADGLAGHLRAAGWTVDVTASLARAAAALAETPGPDVVVFDRLLTDGDAFDLLDGIGADGPPMVLLSARREGRLARQRGAAQVLTKPIAPDAVRAALTALIAPDVATADGGLPAAPSAR
ncbi:MAG: hybrid sensor histidine kinase/response regulator [Acidobacteriota bacterium]